MTIIDLYDQAMIRGKRIMAFFIFISFTYGFDHESKLFVDPLISTLMVDRSQPWLDQWIMKGHHL